ncbi:BLOC-1-related complex subunit 8 homolog [Tubulanus polymorphus]|uniref:BLOC-1-related complex subunit 8 homolog n=1 Tax=Tubulanus polymorphus TaxID=672921 RepID=UPI003DA649F2
MENGLYYILNVKSTMPGSQLFSENSNPDLDHKVRKATEKFSDSLHIVANEPSVAFYRIQEHIRKSLPQLVDERHEIEDLHQSVQGSCFDMEYAIGAVKGMHNSSVHFQNIQDLLKNSMFMKQQIEYENSRKNQETSKPSMYRKLSRHHTLDVPVGINDCDHLEESLHHERPVSAFIPTSSRLSVLPEQRPRSSSLDKDHKSMKRK